MKLSNLGVAARLWIGFAASIVLLVAVGGVGAWRLQTVGSLSHFMVGSVLAKQRLIAEWYQATNSNGYRTLSLLRTHNADDAKALEEKIKTAGATIVDIQNRLKAMQVSAEEKEIFDAIGAKSVAFEEAKIAAIKEKDSGNQENLNRLVEARLQPTLTENLAAFNKIIDFEDDQVDQSAEQIESQYRQGRFFIALIVCISIPCGFYVSYLLARSIIRPLNRAILFAQTVASGDLTSHVEVRGKSELSQLLSSLQTMNQSLINIVNQVRDGADAVAAASEQINRDNQNLSTRTGEQASALENTASTTEQLTSTAQRNGENARSANDLSASASEVAIKGGQVVSQVVETMGAINDSSKKIVDIIGVIDGIAFQTNILALNAAVEAARAGEQGRGFAVVATEVRNLAQRSAAAAKEIKTLIGTSVEKVDAGARLVDQAGATMEDIVSSIGRVTNIIGEITIASREQASGIEQIGRSITQMDSITQENMSLVVESVGAAENLLQRAMTLKNVVQVFKIDGKKTRSEVAAASAKPRAQVAKSGARIKNEVPQSPTKLPAPRIEHPVAAGGDDWEEF